MMILQFEILLSSLEGDLEPLRWTRFDLEASQIAAEKTRLVCQPSFTNVISNKWRTIDIVDMIRHHTDDSMLTQRATLTATPFRAFLISPLVSAPKPSSLGF
jgi:hypothetical protein